MLHSALFLDRDGVINHNHGYVYKPEDFDFIKGVFDVARYAHAQSYKLVVITNQAGIARGYYTAGSKIKCNTLIRCCDEETI
jgi:D-glycero-D-manno-heptose 1,7-bisphosphate phosphatase